MAVGGVGLLGDGQAGRELDGEGGHRGAGRLRSRGALAASRRRPTIAAGSASAR